MCSRSVSKHQRKFCLVSNRFVYIAYQVRISCKGSLSAALYVYCYLENQLYVFQTAPVVVYPSDVNIEYVTVPVSLTELVFM